MEGNGEANPGMASVLCCSLLLATLTVEQRNDGVIYARIKEARTAQTIFILNFNFFIIKNGQSMLIHISCRSKCTQVS